MKTKDYVKKYGNCKELRNIKNANKQYNKTINGLDNFAIAYYLIDCINKKKKPNKDISKLFIKRLKKIGDNKNV